jgi:hypothetical protein
MHRSLGSAGSRRLRHGLPWLAALTAAAVVQAAPSYAAANPAAADQWSLPTTAVVGADSSFKAVDAISPTDAWAVGATQLYTQGQLQATLVEHWDGTRWGVVPSPNASNVPTTGQNANVLNAVDAISAQNVWAVGYTGIAGFGGSASLVEHWNGSSWTVVSSPNGVLPSYNFYNVLLGVGGSSATDVWAVGWNGYLLQPSLQRPTIQHWNGTSWSLNIVPPIGNNAQNIVIQSVTARAANDAWATGYYSDQADAPITHALTLHWNGTAWTRVDAPEPTLGTLFNKINLQAVKALAVDDVWAAGNVSYIDAQGAGQVQTLIEHWDGTHWSVVPSPVVDSTASTLTGLAAVGAGDIWAAGTTGSPADNGARDPLLEHWDGTQWTVVSTPRPDKAYNCGYFGAAATTGRAHAVGACIAMDAGTQPHAVPLAATTPAVTGGGATAPAAPTALVSTATSRSQIRLTWNDNADNETGFRIERCQGAGCTNFTEVATTGAGSTTLLDGGLTRNTTYTYRMRAFNTTGTSPYSNTAATRTPRN